MPAKWPEKRRLIGTKVPRIDGPDKATGRARYSYDINRPGMLHAVILRSPHAHAQITAIDLTAAEKIPGVKATFVINDAGKEVFYAGDEVLAIAADTEEHALDAMRAAKVTYKEMPFFVDEHAALKKPAERTTRSKTGNVTKPTTFRKGDVEKGFQAADAVSEGTYGAFTICHQCLEPHGLVAEWTADDELTVWASTQAVAGTAQQLAERFQIPVTKVKCITHHMGGGYGSKFGPDIQGFVAAELAKKAKKAVKLMLDRADEITVGGNRPSVFGTVKIGGKKDGTITAYEVKCYGTPGESGGATVNFGALPYVYADAIENISREHTVVFTNAGKARAMRAPGHPQNCLLTDTAVDDLAAKLGIDPLIVRRKNLPPNAEMVADKTTFLARRNTLYNEQLDIVTKMCDWAKVWHEPGKGPRKGVWAHGVGMALHTWGGNAAGQPNEVTVRITRDGKVTVSSSTQDLGTAQRTVNAIISAEILGLEVPDVVVQIGESQYGRSSGSGGSTTLPSQAPATLLAATAARDDLFAKVAPKVQAQAADLSVEKGKVVDTKSGKSWTWAEFCARLGMEEAKGVGEWSAKDAGVAANKGISSGQVGGVQVAQVWVDMETGVVKCSDFWAVQDCGLLINKLACESQVAGGVIMGVNYAMFEERIMDTNTGRQVNADMEFYKLGGIEDMPRIHIHMQDMPERGVIGIGEPPTISTAAAVGNAVFNATGARVGYAPYTPQRVLEALAKGAKV